jgi:hypothetical protein
MKNIRRTNDLTGKRFGKLVVLGLDDRGTRKTYWVCQCDCGKVKSVRSDALQCGAIRSCGCLKKEQDRINLTANHSHKQSNTRIYRIWQGVKKRCESQSDARYMRYGGRGIKVCEEWKNSFETFFEWALNNGYTDSLTIDRIDNNGNYCPENCRWVDIKTQCNNRESNIKIKIGNTTKSLLEWCEIFNVDYSAVNERYNRNGFISVNDLFNNVGQYRGNQQTADTVERSE